MKEGDESIYWLKQLELRH